MEAPEPGVKRHKSSTLEDRISNLPDSILSHILSKLSTKHAAGTALLSTRWKNLISQIPNLKIDINDCELLTPHTTPNNHRNAIFIKYVYNLLTVTLRDVPRVRKCFMYLKQTYPDHDLNAWISAIVRLNVSCLWVFFQDNHVGLSSDVLFHSEFLSCLVLFNHNFMNIKGSVSLPILKTLILINITFLYGDLVERVISACPVLDSLSVSHCRIKEVVSVLRISSCSVKKVRLMMMSECCGDEAYEIVLDMPALESLHYVDHLPESYSVKNLNGVCEAHIDVGPSKKQFEEVEAEVMWHRLQSVRDLLGACSRIRSLFLSSISIAALGCSTRPFPTFNNLTELTLGCICTTLWELLPQMLESAPSLEVLVFKGFSQCKGCYAKFQSNVPENVPRCLTLHLRTIKFEAFKGVEDEIDLVEYFLKHAQLLWNIKFELSCSLSQDEISSTKSKLWSLRNQSRKSEVDFTFEVEIDVEKALLLSHDKHETSNELSK